MRGYSRKDHRNRAQKEKSLCLSCANYVYGKNWTNRITEEHTKQMRATKAGFKDWDEYQEKMPEKRKYKAEVWRITYQQPLETLENFDKRGKCGVEDAYQIDHITSVTEGFRRGIPPKEIGHISNLRMLPWKENLLKSNGEK